MATLHEHDCEYPQSLARPRAAAKPSDTSYFVDDEPSRLLMLGYAVHLVTTGLAPVLSVLASVSMVLLAFLVGAVVAIVRFGAGRRPTTLAPPKQHGRRRLWRGAPLPRGRAGLATGGHSSGAVGGLVPGGG